MQEASRAIIRKTCVSEEPTESIKDSLLQIRMNCMSHNDVRIALVWLR
jgi:hypothetical protein